MTNTPDLQTATAIDLLDLAIKIAVSGGDRPLVSERAGQLDLESLGLRAVNDEQLARAFRIERRIIRFVCSSR